MSQEERLKVVGIITVLVMAVIFIVPPTSRATNNQIEPGSIIITEIMANPKMTSDTAGEWFEIYNPTENEIDLSSCEFTDNGSNKFIIEQLIIPSKAYLILARNNNQDENGGLIPDYTYSGYTLANSEDAIILTCQEIEIDRVEYSSTLDFIIPDGASIILKDLKLDNNTGNNWCVSSSVYGSGDKGTPKLTNDICTEDSLNNNQSPPETNRPPVAEAGSNKIVVIGQTVQFDAGGSYDPDGDTLKFSWEFGDGNKTTGKTANHTYQQANIYSVTLTVDDGKIAQSDSLTVTVTQPQITNYKNLIISELMPNPEGSDDDEWIELYNQSDQPIDLSGLNIVDASNKKYILNNEDFASLIIPANGYFIIPRTISKINLNNTPPETVAIALANNEIINEVTYIDSAKEGWSLIFYDNEYYWTSTPTPGYANNLYLPTEKDNNNQNKITEPIVNTDDETISINKNCQSAKNNQLILNELLPSPQGDDRLFEFIEIKNISTLPAKLCGWSISDPTKQYFLPDEIVVPPLGYYLVEANNSRISLNNNGDQISLYDSNDELVDFTSYGKAGIDQSWSRTPDNNWLWTKNISPGEENVFSENITIEITNSTNKSQTNSINDYVYLPLEEINQAQTNDKVIVSGIVTAEPGVLGSQIMYIMNLNGLQIYQHFKRWPPLAVGDRVEIKGVMSFPSGQPRLKVQTADDIFILEKNQFAKLVLPIVTTDELTEELIGSLVTIVGTAVEIKKSSLILADDQGEINLVIKPSTEINLPLVKEGDIIETIGILDKTTAGWRLLPRYNEDIKIIEVKGFATSSPILENKEINLKNTTNHKFINYLYITLLTFIILLSRLIYKLKKQQYGYTNNQKAN